MSVIDYFISTPDIFQIVDQFIVSNFTVYSDHAPLHVKLMIRSDQVLSKLILLLVKRLVESSRATFGTKSRQRLLLQETCSAQRWPSWKTW